MPAKEPVLSHAGLRSLVTPFGSTVIELSPPGHTASKYLANIGEFDAGVSHP
jgi:hypothetical protein